LLRNDRELVGSQCVVLDARCVGQRHDARPPMPYPLDIEIPCDGSNEWPRIVGGCAVSLDVQERARDRLLRYLMILILLAVGTCANRV
jgi:hypothetical protein